MRSVLTLTAALALAATAAQAGSIPPAADPGIAVLKQHLKSPDNTHFASVKVDAEGTVCGKASGGESEDVEFTVSKAGAVWVNEATTTPYSAFTYDSAVNRSTERSYYLAWKACQKSK
jgi:hypothetical protein